MTHSNEDAVMMPAARHWTIQQLSDASHIIMRHAPSVNGLKKDKEKNDCSRS